MSNPDDDPAFEIDSDGDAAAYDEWAALAGELALPALIIRTAISPIVPLLSTRSPRAQPKPRSTLFVTQARSSCWPGQGPERPRR